MSVVTLEERRRGLVVAARASRLLSLDDIWTRCLDKGIVPAAEDAPVIISLGEEMQHLLSASTGDADFVHDLVTRDLAGNLSSLGRMLDLASRAPEERVALRTRLLDDGGLIRVLDRAQLNFSDVIRRDHEDIEAKLGLLRSGKATPGDLSQETKCFLGGVVFGATAATAYVTSSAAEGLFAIYQAYELAGTCF